MQTVHSTLLTLLVWLISVGLVAWPSGDTHALSLGGFESGDFTGWTTTGDTLVVDNAFGSGPAAGSLQALLSTVNDASNADDFASFSFTSNAVSVSALETFLGLAAGSLDALASGGSVAEGSAIRRTFTANAGDTLSVAWNFLTDETGAFDLSFVLIDANLILLADSTTAFAGSSMTIFLNETGYQTFSTVLSTAGAYTVALGVVDTDDRIGASGLLVDDVTLTTVPEPGTLALLSLGLACLVGYHQWRQRS